MWAGVVWCSGQRGPKGPLPWKLLAKTQPTSPGGDLGDFCSKGERWCLVVDQKTELQHGRKIDFFITSLSPQDFHSLATYLSQNTSSVFLDIISDFHLLLFLVTNEVMPLRVRNGRERPCQRHQPCPRCPPVSPGAPRTPPQPRTRPQAGLLQPGRTCSWPSACSSRLPFQQRVQEVKAKPPAGPRALRAPLGAARGRRLLAWPQPARSQFGRGSESWKRLEK